MDKKFCIYETYKVPWPLHNYIGKTSVDKINNGYMGSGVLINRAINKHGVENFNIKILEEFENENDAYNAEINYISLKKPYYNIHPGGYINGAITVPSNVDMLVKGEREKGNNRPIASTSFNLLYNKNLSSDAKILYILLKSLKNDQCSYHRDVLSELLGTSLHRIRKALNELKRMDLIEQKQRRNGLTDIIKIKNNIIDVIDTDVGETLVSLGEENIRLQEIIWEITQKAAQAFKTSKD